MDDGRRMQMDSVLKPHFLFVYLHFISLVHPKMHLFFLKAVIDGFDPDKFRKVNKGGGGGVQDRSHAPATASSGAGAGGGGGGAAGFGPRSFGDGGRGRMGASAAAAEQQMDMPGAVPTYDRSEQQLMASLERELGVM